MGFNFSVILSSQAEELKLHLGEEHANHFLTRVKENRTSLMDISEKVLAPHFGYKTLDEYYADSQSVGSLHKIRVPTFFLNALDDPTIDPSLYPYKEFENNDHIIAGFTKRGGHCGHFTGGFRPY